MSWNITATVQFLILALKVKLLLKADAEAYGTFGPSSAGPASTVPHSRRWRHYNKPEQHCCFRRLSLPPSAVGMDSPAASAWAAESACSVRCLFCTRSPMPASSQPQAPAWVWPNISVRSCLLHTLFRLPPPSGIQVPWLLAWIWPQVGIATIACSTHLCPAILLGLGFRLGSGPTSA